MHKRKIFCQHHGTNKRARGIIGKFLLFLPAMIKGNISLIMLLSVHFSRSIVNHLSQIMTEMGQASKRLKMMLALFCSLSIRQSLMPR